MKRIIVGLLIILIICIIVVNNSHTENTSVNTNIKQNNDTISEIEGTTKNTFVLTDGEVGIYGKEEILDGYEQIIYNIPAGKYTVTFNTNLASASIGTIFVEKNDVITENGEKVHPIVNTYYFNFSNGYSNVIEIESNQHVFITVNSSFTFTEI